MEKIMKKFKVMLIMLMSIMLLAACGKNNEGTKADKITPEAEADAVITVAPVTVMAKEDKAADKIDINIAALKGPTAIGMVKLMNDSDAGTTANNYKFTVSGTADEISAGLVKGDFDIAAVPCNLASALYNNTDGAIKLAGINTLGVLYMVETGDTIKSVADLKGKTIYATGKGTTPQYTLNYILTANGLDPNKDVTIEYKTEPTEVAAMLEDTTDAIAMLPQPYVTTVLMQNSKLRIALNLADEWDKVSKDGSSVVTGVVVARSEFLKNNKEAFDAFMEEYSASAAYVNNSIDDAATLVEKYGIFKAAPTKKAIPFCNITLIQGNEMKEKVGGFLTALYNQEPKSVGGKLPGDDFYYIP
jgi:NitT/TauT family transport system substrate-binding protein